MKKLFSIIVITLTLFLLTTSCNSAQEPNPSGISLDEFNKLKTGMRLIDAVAVFGCSIESGSVQLILDENNSKDGYYEHVTVYKVVGETTGYAELEFTYHKENDELQPSINGLTSKKQYDLS